MSTPARLPTIVEETDLSYDDSIPNRLDILPALKHEAFSSSFS
jgi:hypothetical protein